jgi:hypothetical protein
MRNDNELSEPRTLCFAMISSTKSIKVTSDCYLDQGNTTLSYTGLDFGRDERRRRRGGEEDDTHSVKRDGLGWSGQKSCLRSRNDTGKRGAGDDGVKMGSQVYLKRDGVSLVLLFGGVC